MRMLVSRLAFTLLLSAVAVNSQQASDSSRQPITLTLVQAEQIALKNNPQVTVGKLRAMIAHEFVREQRSALLPTAVTL